MFNLFNKADKALKREKEVATEVANRRAVRASEARVYTMIKADVEAQLQHNEAMRDMAELEAEFKRLGA